MREQILEPTHVAPGDTARASMTAEPVHLIEAWKLLSRDAFAVWVRLAAEPLCLKYGRNALAKHLGMDHRAVTRDMRELRNKGFIRLDKTPIIGTGSLLHSVILERSHFTLLFRPLITAPSGFLKL